MARPAKNCQEPRCTVATAVDGLALPTIFPPTSQKKRKKSSPSFTISNNGTKKEVQWIVDGNEGAVLDCTNEKKGFGNGDIFIPCVSLGARGQQVTTIPFDQVTSRSPKIEQLRKLYSSPNQSKAVIANNNNQNNNNNAALLIITQLQQELEKLLQRADTAEAKNQQKDAVISQK